MLLKNWEIFNPADTDEKHTADREDYIAKTKALKSKYGSLKIVRIVPTQEANVLKGNDIPTHVFPLVARDGLTEWAYTESTGNVKKDKNGNLSLRRKSKIIKKGDWMINVEKEMDLLYFITEKSSVFKNGMFKIDDAREAARLKVAKEKDDIRLKAAIYGDASPLASEEVLRSTCTAVGIKRADTKEEDMLRIELFDFVTAEDKLNKMDAMNITRFLEFIHADEERLRRGFIGKAIDLGYIKYDDMGQYVWGADEDMVITKIPPSRVRDRFAYLCEWFAAEANKKVWDSLEREFVAHGYLEQNNSYEEIKFLCRQHDIVVRSKKKEDLVEELKTLFSA